MNVCKTISNLWRLTLAICAAVCVFAFATPRASAQCEPQWQPFDPSTASYPGTTGTVYATTMWDPDGPGPQTPKLVVGGSFIISGAQRVNRIAVYDPTTGEWSPLGSGMNERVFALAVLPNGHLVAGGAFTTAGAMTANRIARWNGSSWLPLGSGLNSQVNALAVLPDGDLVVGGNFSIAGEVNTSYLARWNGSDWSSLGPNTISGDAPSVSALAVLSSGDLLVGGYFTFAGGVSANSIARWNGSTWSSLGSGISGSVSAVTVLENGDLVAGGFFTSAGGVGARNIARWDGSAWTPFGSGMNDSVKDIAVLPNGDLVAGGRFSIAGGVVANHIARWNGSFWSSMGSGMSGDGSFTVSVEALEVLPNSDVVAGGAFTFVGELRANQIARWNNSVWSALGSGMNRQVNDLALLATGDLVAGGEFTVAGGITANCVARWNGSAWSTFGTAMSGGFFPTVATLTMLSNNDLVVGGSFSIAGGLSANCIARWDGSAWSSLGSGVDLLSAFPRVSTLAMLTNGDLVAGGAFDVAGGVSANRIARWNGSSWLSLGSGMNSSVNALILLSNGDLIAGGMFTTAGGMSANRIARWNGSAWSVLGTGMNGNVNDLALMRDGDVVAVGDFTTAGGVSANRAARWNGSIWSPLGSGLDGSVFAVTILANGHLVAGGNFTTAGGVSANRISLWNGSAWSPLGSGMNATVRTLAVLPNGDVVAGGNFITAGGVVAPYIARWATPVPPTITGQPQSQSITAGQTLVLTASPAAGSAAVSIQWKRNGINITNGPGGASPGGGTVVGASGSMGSITNGTPASLYIYNFQPSDAGDYTATFSNTCGSITSLPASITITPPPCAADFNADTVLDFFDYLDFVSAFAANQPAADFNADTVIDFFDYLDFVAEFANGC